MFQSSIICTNIAEINSTLFSVFPNPLTQTDILYINNINLIKYNIEILDASGKRMCKYNDIESGEFLIPCATFAKGLYILNIDGLTFTEKKILIIE